MAIIKGPSESFRVFNKVKFSDPTDEELKALIDNATIKVAEARVRAAESIKKLNVTIKSIASSASGNITLEDAVHAVCKDKKTEIKL